MATFPRGVWLAYAALAALLGLQAFLPEVGAPPPLPTPPGAAAAIAVDFVAPGAIEVTRIANDAAVARVFVRNDSPHDAKVTLDTVVLDRNGYALQTQAHGTVSARSVAPVMLRIASKSADGKGREFHTQRDGRLPLRGHVVLRALPAVEGAAGPAMKVRDVLVPQVQPSLAGKHITLLGVGAGLLVLLFGLTQAPGAKESSMVPGAPKWTPQSWSTNLAIGGALLTALLAIAGLPASGYYATKANYLAQSTFYAALVALAPTVYGLLKVGPVSQQTALRLFAFAAGVTVWATVGQLGTAATVVLELELARVLSGTAAMAAAVLFWGIAALVVIHALRAVHFYGTGGTSIVPVPVPKPGAPVPPPAPAPADEWPLL